VSCRDPRHRRARHLGLGTVFDVLDAQIVDQRKAEANLDLGGACSLGRVHPESMRVTQRPSVDDVEDVAQRPTHPDGDRDSLVVGVELRQANRG